MSPSRIRTWQFRGITLEMRDNPTGRTSRLPRHSHPEYQIIVSQHLTTRYVYRGASHLAASGSLVILNPHEVHSAQGCEDAKPLVPLRTLLVPPEFFLRVAAETKSSAMEPPFFPKPVVTESGLVSRFLHLHRALAEPTALLEQDARLLYAFAHLSSHYAADRPRWQKTGREREAVRRVRECLEDRFSEDVPLASLADLTGFSPFYLCRVFSQEVGLPPQTYQMQVRVARSKALLIAGRSIGEAALMTGFADQSHFTRQFRKCVGVTPGRYVRHL